MDIQPVSTVRIYVITMNSMIRTTSKNGCYGSEDGQRSHRRVVLETTIPLYIEVA